MPILPFGKGDKTDKKKAVDVRSHNTKQENQLLDLATSRYTNARAAKHDFDNRELHSKWRECDRLYRGNQWATSQPDSKSMPVLNYTFALVESVVSRLTDNNPVVYVRPKRDSRNERLAKQLGSLQGYLWDYNGMPRQIPDAARMCMKYGTVLFKTVWDPDAYAGMGEVRYSVVHPMNFFNDPRAYQIDDMDFCFGVMPKTLEYFKRRWPDKAWLVEADHDWADTEQLDGADGSNEEQVATLYEYWFRDSEGDVSVMYYTKNVVLQIIGGEFDNRKPVYKHNRFPFAKFVDYPADKHFWGIGEVELIYLLQRLINDFEAQIVDNTRLLANGQLVVNKLQSGLREEDSWLFDNSPGNVIWTNNGGVEQLKGMAIPAHVPAHQQTLISAMEQILGVHDVVQGMKPQGVRAASAIIALGEAANIRVRSKASQMEYALKEMVDQGNWLALEFYDSPRQIRLTGTSEIVELDVRKVMTERMAHVGLEAGLFGTDFPTESIAPPVSPDMDMLPGMGMEGMEPSPNMGMSIEESMNAGLGLNSEQQVQVMEEVKFPEFDVEVHIGPSVPYSQALLYEQAKEFYQLGIIDREAVLEATNFPNKEAILKRVEGRQAVGGEGERTGERTFGNPPMM